MNDLWKKYEIARDAYNNDPTPANEAARDAALDAYNAAKADLDSMRAIVEAAYAKIHPAYYEVRNFEVDEVAQYYPVKFTVETLDGEQEDNTLTLYRKDFATTLFSVSATFGTQTINAVDMGNDNFALLVSKELLDGSNNIVSSITASAREQLKEIAYVEFKTNGAPAFDANVTGSATLTNYNVTDGYVIKIRVIVYTEADYKDNVNREYTLTIVPLDDNLFVTLNQLDENNQLIGLEEMTLTGLDKSTLVWDETENKYVGVEMTDKYYVGSVPSDQESVDVTVVSSLIGDNVRITMSDNPALASNPWNNWKESQIGRASCRERV